MLTPHLRYLVALDQTGSRLLAASRCGTTEAGIAEAIAAVEHEFGRPIFRSGTLTPEGASIVEWARAFLDEYDGLQRDLRSARLQTVIAPMLERRSVSPKKLGPPSPTAGELDLILQAALRAPDHGGLHPWRVIEFPSEQRAALADLFEQEKLRRDPLASDGDRHRAREHAIRAPMLLAFVVSPRARSKVPVREQWLAAGAALGNLLNAAHRLGFGAITLSGERCFDAVLGKALGVDADEFLAGFISMGTACEAPSVRKYPSSADVTSRWAPAAAPAARATPSARSSTQGNTP